MQKGRLIEDTIKNYLQLTNQLNTEINGLTTEVLKLDALGENKSAATSRPENPCTKELATLMAEDRRLTTQLAIDSVDCK